MEKRFYKENEIWYIDLPEFLENGLGTKANLMMVDGADLFLDYLSNSENEVRVTFSDQEMEGHQFVLQSEIKGLNEDLLESIGHAKVNYGMYYRVPQLRNHRLWLCPVTEYVFGGEYPDLIYVKTSLTYD